MNSRVELEKQKFEHAFNSLQNKVDDKGKMKEMQNLKDYLDGRIKEEYQNQNQMNAANDIANSTTSINSLKNLRSQLLREIKKTRGEIEKQSQLISQKNQEIMANEAELMKQQEELQYKKNLLLTRDRMLELSQEKNIYKQKVIFTLLAVIFAIILLMAIVFLYLR